MKIELKIDLKIDLKRNLPRADRAGLFMSRCLLVFYLPEGICFPTI